MSTVLNRIVDDRAPLRPPRGLWSNDGVDDAEALMLRLCAADRLDALGVLFWKHISSGGRRVRARLALATAEALGVERGAVVPWAAASELLHNATLVHDDIQDGDRFRRGRESLWSRHGVAQGINAGDLGLMLPYRAVEHVDCDDGVRWRLARTLARHAEEVVRGQSAELGLLQRGRLTWQAYADAALGKTAALFSLPVAGAALIAGKSPEEAEALASAFRPIGLLYQLQDDVLDLYGDKGRESRGSDIREGKVSALVAEHLRLHPEDTGWLVGILSTPRDRTAEEDVEAVIARFANGGALEAVWERISDIEDSFCSNDALIAHDRLHAVALDLVAAALAPTAHTHPHLVVGGAK